MDEVMRFRLSLQKAFHIRHLDYDHRDILDRETVVRSLDERRMSHALAIANGLDLGSLNPSEATLVKLYGSVALIDYRSWRPLLPRDVIEGSDILRFTQAIHVVNAPQN